MASRTIVHIDESRCDGCGECIPSCAEGALMIIGGVAKLVNDKYCDGMGSCLGVCPQDAITLEEREAVEFDENAVAARDPKEDVSHREGRAAPPPAVAAPSCSGSMQQAFGVSVEERAALEPSAPAPSMLEHWPVQLTLLNPGAEFLRNADLLLTADCVPFAYRNFHADFLPGRAVAVACPKLDQADRHIQKLAAIFGQAGLKQVTILRMEVPCCGGLNRLVGEAMRISGARFPVREMVVSVRGELLSEQVLLAG
ncbi:4Fe-4S ferredoxin [bacterium]|nr:4Fe-4S ferredoxin [bacterium]